jgi:hypothetical protein
MIEDEDDDDLTPPVREDLMEEDVFQWAITQLCSLYYNGNSMLENQTQVFNLWLKLGDLLNIFHFLPEYKAVVESSSEESESPLLSFIMTTDKKVLEDILENMDEHMILKLKQGIEKRKGSYS